MGGMGGSVRDECDEGGNGSTVKVRGGEKWKQCFMEKSIDLNAVPKSKGNNLGAYEIRDPDFGVKSFRRFKSAEKQSSSVGKPQKRSNGNSVNKIKKRLYFGSDCRNRSRQNGIPGSNSSKMNASNSKASTGRPFSEGSAQNPFNMEPDALNKDSTDGETDSP
ncbi:hypothetical protein CCACVL1_03915 [Corchorus capsularis]|uniref:Uncharacterized protein n=1 Tax=Corchorus capsularis TaxID=210143 RepID=A0A1R3JWI8_COCAP|nr:hypothetical protein CCACVL1_03915 [Corchorus capsularis]